MSQIDDFAQSLLEESKRFLEKADKEESAGASAYLHASLMLAFSSLEAHVNSISDDFVDRPEMSVHDKSILLEREVRLDKGQFTLSNTLKMVRLEDRIQFLYARFAGEPLQGQIEWWSRLADATKLRNQLTHPKDIVSIKPETVERAIQAIIDTVDALYQVIYKSPFPTAVRGVKSTLNF